MVNINILVIGDEAVSGYIDHAGSYHDLGQRAMGMPSDMSASHALLDVDCLADADRDTADCGCLGADREAVVRSSELFNTSAEFMTFSDVGEFDANENDVSDSFFMADNESYNNETELFSTAVEHDFVVLSSLDNTPELMAESSESTEYNVDTEYNADTEFEGQ